MLLDDIIFNKRQEVTAFKVWLSRQNIDRLIRKAPKPKNFLKIFKKNKLALIAEVKKASPSAGMICKNYKPAILAKAYEKKGASAVSVLTDIKYFKGEIEHLALVRKKIKLPILRKDFIIDASQIFEARINGADAVLLIARVLSLADLVKLLELTNKLGMQALVETHDSADVEKVLKTKAKIIGINNRDLASLKIDLNTSINLIKKYPQLLKRIVVSESGIRTAEDVAKLKVVGVKGILVGESLLKGKTIKELLS